MGLLPRESGFVESGPATHETAPVEVFMLFTDIASTLRALRTAAQLAQGLATRIRLLLLETVPYPLALDEPRRNLGYLGRQFRTLVDDYRTESAGRPVEPIAEIVLCRDAWEGLRMKLPRSSLVVIGNRSRWWPHMEDGLARKLRAAGHHVIRTPGTPASGFFPFSNKGLSHA